MSGVSWLLIWQDMLWTYRSCLVVTQCALNLLSMRLSKPWSDGLCRLSAGHWTLSCHFRCVTWAKQLPKSSLLWWFKEDISPRKVTEFNSWFVFLHKDLLNLVDFFRFSWILLSFFISPPSPLAFWKRETAAKRNWSVRHPADDR